MTTCTTSLESYTMATGTSNETISISSEDFSSSDSSTDSLEASSPRPRVKFSPVVKVTNTLSRHDMTPKEKFEFWAGDDDHMTQKEIERIIAMLTDRWMSRRKEEALRAELSPTGEDKNPILPEIKQRLPATEQEGNDGYTYTIPLDSE